MAAPQIGKLFIGRPLETAASGRANKLMPDNSKIIAANVAALRWRIADAAARAGADPQRITLVAVTKYVGPAEARAVFEAGCTVLGESRPQQLWPKTEALADLPIEWQMIGHLQRNKIRRTLPLVKMIQSVDNLSSIEAIDRIASELSLQMPILLEVNTSGDAQKHGFLPQRMEPLMGELGRFSNVKIQGLMCMASLAGGMDAARRDFSALRELRECLAGDCPESVELRELSMGMSRDYEAAIAEGATIVRVGSALYDGIHDDTR